DGLHLARCQPPVLTGRSRANELADLLRVLEGDRLGELGEHAAAQSANLVERRESLLLAPVVETAHPEVVVLVEVTLLAGRGGVAPPGGPVLEGGELLGAVEGDVLRPPAG